MKNDDTRLSLQLYKLVLRSYTAHYLGVVSIHLRSKYVESLCYSRLTQPVTVVVFSALRVYALAGNNLTLAIFVAILGLVPVGTNLVCHLTA